MTQKTSNERSPAQRNPDGRKDFEIRPLTIETGVNRYAEGSALIRAGHTHVLCTASIEPSVPNWLVGKGKGWITAEYSMLPRSTHTRSKRDREKVSGRTQEIQRLIGRALRSVVDLNLLGEKSIIIDCDVLQADGGTRTASITGGYIALAIALNKLITSNQVPATAWIDSVAAISVGMKSDRVLADLDYIEDSSCDVDMNFVITGHGSFVEVQGTGEQCVFSKTQLDRMTDVAISATQEISRIQQSTLNKLGIHFKHPL